MNNQDRSFYVYGHVLKDTGEFFYIGKGKGDRHKEKFSRNNQWNSTVNGRDWYSVIMFEGMTSNEALKVEAEIITKYKSQLTNKTTSSVYKEIDYEVVSKYFYYDETSPTFLRWKIDDGRKKDRSKSGVGTVAGFLSSYNKVYVTLDRVNYFASRVIYCLFNKQISTDMVVDHIDGNPLNNNINNLRLISFADNARNRAISSRNISGVVGVYKKQTKRDGIQWVATWQDHTGKKKRLHFSVFKFGETVAFEMACAARKRGLEKLEQYGILYTERHRGY